MPNLNRRFASAIVFLLVLAAGIVIAKADEKIKSRQTSQGQSMETTTMIKGRRSRTESDGGQIVTIQQCDLRRSLMIMPKSGVYTVTPYDQPLNAASSNRSGTNGPARSGGVITTTVTTKDTGERKQMLGFAARHIITTMVTVSSPGACTQMNTKMETDGWYIDASFALECEMSNNPYVGQNQSPTGCLDRYEMKTLGAAKRGYPVWEKLSMYGNNGEVSFTTTNEVLEISAANLDASLFDAPAGFREVNSLSEAMSPTSASKSAAARNSDHTSTSAPNSRDRSTNSSNGTNGKTQTQNNPSGIPATIIKRGRISPW
ncbi:MAG: hypothetical protein ABIP75_04190 [Pyrinomonadaceae bacterium]